MLWRRIYVYVIYSDSERHGTHLKFEQYYIITCYPENRLGSLIDKEKGPNSFETNASTNACIK